MARLDEPLPTPREAEERVGLGMWECAQSSDDAGLGLWPRTMELEESERTMVGRNSDAFAFKNRGDEEGLVPVPIGG